MSATPDPPSDPITLPASKSSLANGNQPDPAAAQPLGRDTKPEHTPQTLQQTAQGLTDQALQFLSTASNETIGACLVGLGATTYIVLGRVGLVIMGVVGGVVLHATWEGAQVTVGVEDKAAEERRRREVGLDVVKRALAWRDSNEVEDNEAMEKVEVVKGKKLDFADFQPQTSAALTDFTDAAIRDYVKWWYSPLLPTEMRFPDSCRQTLTAFLLSISSHLSRKRPATAFLDFATHSSSILIVFLTELATAVNSYPSTSTQEAVQQYLKDKPDSNLGYVIDTDHQQKKLELVAEDVLEAFLEHKAYNCEIVRLFLKETIAKLMLDMTIERCSRAEFVNDWIVYLLEDAPPENSTDEKTRISSDSEKVKTLGDVISTQKETENADRIRHKRVVSKAQEAMDEAMQEAARLTQMIAEEEARKAKERGEVTNENKNANSPKPDSVAATVSSTSNDDTSDSTAHGVHTPSSSQSESNKHEESPKVQDVAPVLEEAASPSRPPMAKRDSSFTTFDQLVPQERPTALLEEAERKKREPPPLTLHKAKIMILDDSDPSDRREVKNKPTTEYLIQVEPATSYYPGWMIVRKYSDFEKLHENVGRISKITQSGNFAAAHAMLPPWRGTTKTRLREDLERYLLDAMQHLSLAESSGMKIFLDKESATMKSPAKGGFPGFGAIENVGKGMVDVLTQAPKGVATGGKAIIGGVGNVLGGSKTPKKNGVTGSPTPNRSTPNASSQSLAKSENVLGISTPGRQSQESLRASSPVVDTQPAPVPQMERRPSHRSESQEPKKKPAPVTSWEPTPILGGDQIINLPPPPSQVSDDYEYNPKEPISTRQSVDTPPRISTSTVSSTFDLRKATITEEANPSKPAPLKKPLTEQEAQMAVELGLASITELYKLSSAWSIRLAFLNTAKSILLRPGNAQLDSLRQLLQDTVLDANTSDAGIAAHLRTLRANSLPTEAELAAWPAERTAEQREELRRRARKLLLERGMPQALNSVMGQAASAEALGRVFDALQVQKVARGLVFGLMLQALRAVTQ